MKKTFVSNLLKTANYLGKDHGLPKTADIQEATGMVLTHIITSVLGEAEHSGCYLLPTESHVEEKHVEKVVVVGAAFLCFVGTSLYFCLKDEGIEDGMTIMGEDGGDFPDFLTRMYPGIMTVMLVVFIAVRVI